MRFSLLLLAFVMVAVGVAGTLRLAVGSEATAARSTLAQSASRVRAEATRGCASRVESGGRRPRRTRAGRDDIATPSVIFHGLRLAVDFDPDDAYRPGGGDAVYKAPLSVRAGPRVILELSARDGARLALDYDRQEWLLDGRTIAAGHGQRAMRFVPCSPDEPRFSGPGAVGQWTQFNGGLLIATRGCATLRVWRDGRPVERASLAVGMPARRCG